MGNNLKQCWHKGSPHEGVGFAVVIVMLRMRVLEPLLVRTPAHPPTAAQAPWGGSKCPWALGAMLSFP